MPRVVTISKKQPPPFIPNNCKEWERGTDPWHKSGFPSHLADYAPSQEDKPKTGWYMIEWTGNVIGFVPDGQEFVSDNDGVFRVK